MRFTSSAERTNEAASQSASCSTAKRRSSRSAWLSGSSESRTPCTCRLLRPHSSPPRTTSQCTASPRTATTRRSIAPSSISTVAPGSTSRGSRRCVTDVPAAVAILPSTCNTNASPGISETGSFATGAVRTSGPRVSSITAIGTAQRCAAARTRAMRAACSACEPCERLMRATFMPARIIASSVSGASQAGPIVATILVRRGAASCDMALPLIQDSADPAAS